jgi:hypothetical protein
MGAIESPKSGRKVGKRCELCFVTIESLKTRREFGERCDIQSRNIQFGCSFCNPP